MSGVQIGLMLICLQNGLTDKVRDLLKEIESNQYMGVEENVRKTDNKSKLRKRKK